MQEKSNTNKKLNYVSLFSWAWIGCYWFKLENFNCVATCELLEKRIKFQRYNETCKNDNWYITWDIRSKEIQDKIRNNINKLDKDSLDVLIATPPCQWMSVANHKKNNEIIRNSLVVESIVLTKEFQPKFFIFENVRSFLNTLCTDIDWVEKSIKEVINIHLSWKYNILFKVLNFKNYWGKSSRTRTLVIGTRKDQKYITPYDITPSYEEERSLYNIIWDLPSLNKMWEISKNDIFHQFKSYAPHMRERISILKEWESAFDNKDDSIKPHKIINWIRIQNLNKNSDKYKRQIFNKVAPCIHTRNDIFASQNTVHPKDDRVFSIRELMRMMSIPDSFKRSAEDISKLNQYSLQEKSNFLKKEEMNIRHSIGEWVPTEVFRKIAENIKNNVQKNHLSYTEIKNIIEKNSLNEFNNLESYIEKNIRNISYESLLTIAELANSERTTNWAYYTDKEIIFDIINNLPDFKNKAELSILEPSVWVWSFLPLIFKKYEEIKNVTIDVIDIDSNSINLLKLLLKKLKTPKNIKINFIEGDFLEYKFNKKYNLVIGNPPFWKVKDKIKLNNYLGNSINKKSNNIVSFFIEKSLNIWENISLIIPKSILNAPEFNITRDILNQYNINTIIDFWENWFKGVKIETIAIIIDVKKKNNNNITNTISLITQENNYKLQSYIIDSFFPYWLIYRNIEFDNISKKLEFNIFTSFRDRQITKTHILKKGKIRILKSRNIWNNKVIDIEWYDCYIDNIDNIWVRKFLNKKDIVLVPNLTYNPRACFLPKNSLVDWSVAILSPKDDNILINKKDLEYFSSEEFKKLYKIARNYWTRSLNIDNNSVFYFGKLK